MRLAVVLGFVGLAAGNASGQALEQYYVTTTGGTSSQRCGESMALDGDMLVMGAPYNDTNGTDSGAAFVLHYDAATDSWIQDQELFPSDPEVSARFGTGVAIEGDLIVVGASLKNKNATTTDTGAIYVFRFDSTANTWSEEQKLVASNATAGDQFGAAVGVDSAANLIIVGAPLSNTAAGVDAGSAYVFRYQNSTVKWVEETQLLDPDAAISDHAGTCVATDGTIVVVGSPLQNEGTKADQGSVGIWSFDGTNWNQDQEIVGSNAAISNWFGSSVALDGDELAVGSPLEDASTTVVNSGAAYLFRRSAGVWSEEVRLPNPAPVTSTSFGLDVAVRGDLLVVGAPLDNLNGLSDSGSAWTFRRNKKKGGWFTDQLLGASDAAVTDHLGTQVEIHSTEILATASFNNVTAGSDYGVLYGYDIREIVLTIDPTNPAPGQAITFNAFRGDPGQVVMITVEDVSGTTLFLPILTYVFASDHSLTFSVNAPNPAYGLHVGLRAYKVSPTGPVVFSPLAYVDV